MKTTELAHFSEVVGLIYEGATDPSRWTKDILPAVGEYLQAPVSVMFNPLKMPLEGGLAFIHGMPQQQMDVYTTHYYKIDVHAQMAFAKGLVFEGNVILDTDILPQVQLRETQYHKEYLTPWDITYALNAIVFGVNSVSGASACVIANWRRSNGTPYTEGDREKLKLLVPHLSRSLGVMQRIQSAELTVASTLAALDRLPMGVVLVDTQGEVTFANHSAQRMFEMGDGLRLRKLTNTAGLGRLIADSDAHNQAIHSAILATVNRDPYAAEHFSKYVTVPQTSRLACYTLQFSALGNHHEYNTGSNAPAAIIFIADGHQSEKVDPELLRGTYGLTNAEARVAIVLMECATLQEVADCMNTSIDTVRTHVKQIYAKLAVDTRARFVKLMMGLASSCSSKV
jgi:DNA-binding CsgD family transcriptional regulator/PAS domain-containing protein